MTEESGVRLRRGGDRTGRWKETVRRNGKKAEKKPFFLSCLQVSSSSPGQSSGGGEGLKLSCNSICLLERIRKSIPPFTQESRRSPRPVWSPYQPQPGITGLSGAHGSVATQAQLWGGRGGGQTSAGVADGGHADQIKFPAL